MNIDFINVDLEIEGHDSFEPLVNAFGDNVVNLYCGEAHSHQLATFEIEGALVGDPDSLISYFCMLIEAFDKKEKALWNKAFRKVFNIGYGSGLEPRSYESNLRAETIAQVAKIGASIQITIYPPYPKNQNDLQV